MIACQEKFEMEIRKLRIDKEFSLQDRISNLDFFVLYF